MPVAVALLFALGFYAVLLWAVRRTRRLAGRSALPVLRHGGLELRLAALLHTLFPAGLVVSTLRPDIPWLRPIPGLSPALPWIAAALFAGGLTLEYAALRALGRAFRIGIDPDQPGPLVTGGPYRLIRHPVYAAFMADYVAAWLLQPNVLFGLLAPLAILRLYLQARREEGALLQQHGAAYAAYARSTSRFIPLLW
jgi:protein-S-isoprenylcysteine O-methyltransferase Ste14